MTINIDISDIIEEFDLLASVSNQMTIDIVNEVTQEIYRNWVLEASNELKSTKQEYINNLQILHHSDYFKTILLTGVLPIMIEKGASPFDMKIGFSKSKKIKWFVKKKNGRIVKRSWYLTIPFRHATPGAIGDNQIFSSKMPVDVYEVVKSKMPNSPVRKDELNSPYDLPSSRAAISTPTGNFPKYRHKNPIYEGIMKKQAAYKNAVQNTYISFRRVSENSDPNSWIHSGIKAHNFMKRAVNSTDVNIIAENKVDEILEKLGYGKQ